MLALFAALFLASAPAAPARCGLDRLEACANTNQLVWDRTFQAALKGFFRKQRGSYLDDDLPLVDQAIETLGGPPDDAKRLANGNWLFTACVAHDCPQKGGVVLSSAGKVLAAAMLTNHCHKVPPGQSPCERGQTLDIFVERLATAAKDPNVATLKAWGEAAANVEHAADGYGLGGPFQGVEIRGLRDDEDYAAKHPLRRRARR